MTVTGPMAGQRRLVELERGGIRPRRADDVRRDRVRGARQRASMLHPATRRVEAARPDR